MAGGAFPGGEYRALVKRVVDGDTYEVEVDLGFRISHTIRVRLKDVDTPEIFGGASEDEKRRGRMAKTYVEGVILNTWVLIRTSKARSFNRWVADVWYYSIDDEARSLADAIVEHGHGVRVS